MNSFKCPCCADGSGSTSFNLWRHHHATHPECPVNCPYHQKYPRNPPPMDPVVTQLMHEVGTFINFRVLFSFFFLRRPPECDVDCIAATTSDPTAAEWKSCSGESLRLFGDKTQASSGRTRSSLSARTRYAQDGTARQAPEWYSDAADRRWQTRPVNRFLSIQFVRKLLNKISIQLRASSFSYKIDEINAKLITVGKSIYYFLSACNICYWFKIGYRLSINRLRIALLNQNFKAINKLLSCKFCSYWISTNDSERHTDECQSNLKFQLG